MDRLFTLAFNSDISLQGTDRRCAKVRAVRAELEKHETLRRMLKDSETSSSLKLPGSEQAVRALVKYLCCHGDEELTKRFCKELAHKVGPQLLALAAALDMPIVAEPVMMHLAAEAPASICFDAFAVSERFDAADLNKARQACLAALGNGGKNGVFDAMVSSRWSGLSLDGLRAVLGALPADDMPQSRPTTNATLQLELVQGDNGELSTPGDFKKVGL